MSSIVEALIPQAIGAAQRAYCPYSKFAVGAAVHWDGGLTTAGCNVENAAWSPSLCAERNAISHGIFRGGGRITHVVVYTPTTEPTTPCGVCLQVIREFGPNAQIVCVCDGDQRIVGVLGDFLPRSFGPESIES